MSDTPDWFQPEPSYLEEVEKKVYQVMLKEMFPPYHLWGPELNTYARLRGHPDQAKDESDAAFRQRLLRQDRERLFPEPPPPAPPWYRRLWDFFFEGPYRFARSRKIYRAPEECQLPPTGWRCTRGPHADGPCAAIPQETTNG